MNSSTKPADESTAKGQADRAISLQTSLLANSVDEAAKLGTHFAQNFALRQLAARADTQSLVEMLVKSKEIQSTRFRRETQDVATQWLAKDNPELAYEHAIAIGDDRAIALTTVVFQEWSMSNLKSAFAFALKLSDEEKQAALQGILDSRDDLSESELLDIANQLGLEQLAIDHLAHSAAREEISDPDKAWQTFLRNHRHELSTLSESQRQLLQSITGSLIDKHGLTVFYDANQLLQRDDSIGESAINTETKKEFL